jgi:hypothetical protein
LLLEYLHGIVRTLAWRIFPLLEAVTFHYRPS